LKYKETDTIRWYSPENPPDYKFHVCGGRSVNIFIALVDGSVWPGDYTEGKFYVFGAEVDMERIGAWCRYPKRERE
jgi:hypothetical protein